MITDKLEAIKEMSKEQIDFNQFDKSLLQDKDVALAYMQRHSSNNMLIQDFPIDIDVPGMVDDEEFIINVIKNLDVGYREESLKSLIKYSTFRIVKDKISKESDGDVDKLKGDATQILTTYNKELKLRIEQLSQKNVVLDEVNNFINEAQLDAFDAPKKRIKPGNYKSCNIGFTAEIK